jgi:hypothetical protein
MAAPSEFTSYVTATTDNDPVGANASDWTAWAATETDLVPGFQVRKFRRAGAWVDTSDRKFRRSGTWV